MEKNNNPKYPEELTMEESEKFDFKIFDGDSFKEDYENAVKYAKKKEGQVYTMVDGEDGKTYYLKGLHYVNRFAYCVLNDSESLSKELKKSTRNKSKKIRDINRNLEKLKDEGFINFNDSPDNISDFIENDFNYIVFGKDGRVGRHTSCKLACGLTKFELKKVIDKELNLKEPVSQKEKEEIHKYFNKNNLRLTWYSYACYKKLGVVFLNPNDYKIIKYWEAKKMEELLK